MCPIVLFKNNWEVNLSNKPGSRTARARERERRALKKNETQKNKERGLGVLATRYTEGAQKPEARVMSCNTRTLHVITVSPLSVD